MDNNGCFLHTFPVFRHLTNLSACNHFAASTIIIVSSTILTEPVYVCCLTQDLNITIQLAYSRRIRAGSFLFGRILVQQTNFVTRSWQLLNFPLMKQSHFIQELYWEGMKAVREAPKCDWDYQDLRFQ